MKDFWDTKYAGEEYVYGVEPNAFYKSWIDMQKIGSVLFVAEGEGRNAVYAAILGWGVTAFDYSREGRTKALLLAEENNTQISYEVSAAETFATIQKFDAIVLIFAHFPSNIRTDIHRNLAGMLKKGGQLVLEAYGKTQLDYGTGGPKNIELLYSVEELKNDFDGLEILGIGQKLRFINEGILHHGESSVIQLIATKKK